MINKNLTRNSYRKPVDDNLHGEVSSRITLLTLLMILPMPAYAANVVGHLTLYYMFYVIPIVLLLHLIAMIYFQKRDRYRSKAFTSRHLIIVMLFLVIGAAVTMFEYLTNMSSTGMHIGTFLSIVFVYGFIALLFAIPYLLHFFTIEK